MLEYLFIVRVVRVFFKPTYQSIPTIRNVSIPIVTVGMDDIL